MAWLILFASTTPISAQSNIGELRLKVTDPAGAGIKSAAYLVNGANLYEQAFTTDDTGSLVIKRLPFGLYQLKVEHEGLASSTKSIEIRSAAPTEVQVRMGLIPVRTTIEVREGETLIDPRRAGSVNQIGSASIADRTASVPGRSVQDLVDSQPGWLQEGNAVLHPRGSEYQTQFVLDGIPLTDNRSPGYGPEIEAESLESIKLFTAGIPAEYGRKMGGVVEINSARDSRDGLHGEVVLSGASFDTAGA